MFPADVFEIVQMHGKCSGNSSHMIKSAWRARFDNFRNIFRASGKLSNRGRGRISRTCLKHYASTQKNQPQKHVRTIFLGYLHFLEPSRLADHNDELLHDEILINIFIDFIIILFNNSASYNKYNMYDS